MAQTATTTNPAPAPVPEARRSVTVTIVRTLKDGQTRLTPRSFEVHELADLFPTVPPDQLAELTADIRDHGLTMPILVDERGILIDGRNRLIAMRDGDIPLRPESISTVKKDPGESDVAYLKRIKSLIFSLNITRRHLDTSQRAMIAADLANMTRADASALGVTARGQGTKGNSALGTPPTSIPAAAEMLNVSERTVKDAKAIKAASPELAEAVRSGDITVGAAKAVTADPVALEMVKSGKTTAKEAVTASKAPKPIVPHETMADDALMEGVLKPLLEMVRKLHRRLDEVEPPLMTPALYKTLLMALHPDYSMSVERRTEAFQAFQALEGKFTGKPLREAKLFDAPDWDSFAIREELAEKALKVREERAAKTQKALSL